MGRIGTWWEDHRSIALAIRLRAFLVFEMDVEVPGLALFAFGGAV